jgi:Protein of unknown function (DUF4244)
MTVRLRLPILRQVRTSIHSLMRRALRSASRRADAGMATAEYAVATLAACGFAALLLTLLRSGEVRAMLAGIIRRALSVG